MKIIILLLQYQNSIPMKWTTETPGHTLAPAVPGSRAFGSPKLLRYILHRACNATLVPPILHGQYHSYTYPIHNINLLNITIPQNIKYNQGLMTQHLWQVIK